MSAEKNILFLTTHNLATNPRLVKEIRLATDNGFRVEVICFSFDNWSKDLNEQLITSFSEVRFIVIQAGRKPFLPWFKSVAGERCFRFFSRFFRLSELLLARAVSRRNILIIEALEKVNRPDWVIGHNPGALYATAYAAKKFNCRSGFDVEDYHPGEGHDLSLQRLSLELMKKCLPSLTYLTFASDSIRQACMDAIPSLKTKLGRVVNNAFPQAEFRSPDSLTEPVLRLVWFSQHISYGRGLEQLIPVIDSNHEKLNLTLYGNADSAFQSAFQKYKGVDWKGPMDQKSLHMMLSNFDAGLAIEPGKDFNNELALSNKMLAYLQAGLYIVATDTIEQKRFLSDYPSHGIVIKKDFSDLEKVLLNLYGDISNVRRLATQRHENADAISWDVVSKVTAAIWQNNS